MARKTTNKKTPTKKERSKDGSYLKAMHCKKEKSCQTPSSSPIRQFSKMSKRVKSSKYMSGQTRNQLLV